MYQIIPSLPPFLSFFSLSNKRLLIAGYRLVKLCSVKVLIESSALFVMFFHSESDSICLRRCLYVHRQVLNQSWNWKKRSLKCHASRLSLVRSLMKLTNVYVLEKKVNLKYGILLRKRINLMRFSGSIGNCFSVLMSRPGY